MLTSNIKTIRPKSLLAIVFFVQLILTLSNCSNDVPSVNITSEISLDKEQEVAENKVLTSSTQSLNRYHSVLRDFKEANLSYEPKSKTITLQLSQNEEQLKAQKIEGRFLVPLLPYKHESQINDFDKANLTLAEFARNGVNLSFQEENTKFGYFNSSPGLFNDEAEFEFDGTKIIPNKNVRPKRFSVINNCLNPGLWELSASDAVGEMFHSWIKLPKEEYFQIVKNENNITNPVEELHSFINNSDEFKQIPAEIDRLRSVKNTLFESVAQLNAAKELGAYSSQDSRRKVQRGFYKIVRNEEVMEAKTFGDLQSGDVFSLYSFKNPGVYNQSEPNLIKYDPDWSKAVFREVKPMTTYGGDHDGFSKFGYLEIELFSSDEKRSIIASNIPIQLLAFGEDYRIPAFGAGVLDASEPIERRYLRFEKGPYPHFAYLLSKENEQSYLINNHTTGYEQIYFRPLLEHENLFLKMTLVSYERIVDLVEFKIPVEGQLKEKILQASKEFKKPIHEVYQDSNIF